MITKIFIYFFSLLALYGCSDDFHNATRDDLCNAAIEMSPGKLMVIDRQCMRVGPDATAFITIKDTDNNHLTTYMGKSINGSIYWNPTINDGLKIKQISDASSTAFSNGLATGVATGMAVNSGRSSTGGRR